MSLDAEALAVRYGSIEAVAPVDLTLARGELVALVGPNGAGKSSLLRALAGIRSTEGRVSWQGSALAAMGTAQRARTIAYLPQLPQANWPLAARELVALGRLPHGRFGRRPGALDEAAVERAMALTGMAALADRPMNALSGGERMRAHLARAFAVEAPVLLVDEPVASLDPYHQLSVMRILGEHAAQGRLVMAVLHDLTLAARHCSRMLLMDGGRIVVDGAPADVLDEGVLARHYRIRAYLDEHAGRRVVVPWEMLE